MFLRHAAAAGLFAAVATFALPAAAQVHEGDIELSVVAGRIVTDGHSLLRFGSGLKVFEGNFGDVSGGPFSTDDPGYDNSPGTFANGTAISYRALGVLEFWNGSGWTASSTERVTLAGNLGEITVFQGAGVSGDTTGLVGQSGVVGEVHEHLDMTVARNGGGVPLVGAYMIQLQLTGTGLLDSQPYFIALNRGLSDTAFDNAVQALAVPEPASYLLLAGGLFAVGATARARRAQGAKAAH